MKQKNSQRNNSYRSLHQHLFVSILSFFFNLLYHRLAWTYDWIAYIVSLGAWKDWGKSVIPYLSGPKILEIGYGPGHLLTSLHQLGFSVFGLDESPQMARMASRRIRNQGMYPCLTRGYAQSLPFADESFHQVVMTFPAEFIFKTQTIAEIYRVLTRDGMAIIVPFAWITGRNPIQRMLAWLFRITGETPEWDEKSLEPLKNLGFDLSWRMIDYSSSKILLIQMIKRSDPR